MNQFKIGNRWVSPTEARAHRDAILAEQKKSQELLEKNSDREQKEADKLEAEKTETSKKEVKVVETKKEEKKEFKCEECGFVAKNKTGLSAHKRSHK